MIDEDLADIEQAAQPLVEVEESDPDSDYFKVPFDRPVEGYVLDYIYIPKDKIGSVEPFSPYKSEQGRQLDSLSCTCNADGSFTIKKSDGSAF